jgi:hypothetical protein
MLAAIAAFMDIWAVSRSQLSQSCAALTDHDENRGAIRQFAMFSR